MRQQYNCFQEIRSKVITSHCTVTFLEEEKPREGTTFNYCPVYGTSMDKCWDIYWQNHFFHEKLFFLFPLSWRKSPHIDSLLKRHLNQSLNTWSARAKDLDFTVPLTSSTRACSGICSIAQGQGHLGLLGENCVSWDSGRTGRAACWDLSLLTPALWSFQSTELFSTKSFFTTLIMIMRDSLQTLHALSAR